MNLAILFWFYKEPEICENRLQILKKNNPNLKIFGLFGGEKKEVDVYKEKLGKYLDDFYVFSANHGSDWKWINGDLMILDWYENRGVNLMFDSVVVVQWDMLVFDSLEKQLSGIKKREIFLSGLKNLDEETEKKWDWTTPDGKERQNYINFLGYTKDNYGYKDNPPLCCLFIIQVFPRIFFEKYLTVENREIGMLEYKVPIYAKIFDVPFYEKDFGVRWHGSEIKPLNAIPEEIPEQYIRQQLSKESGWRLFHPYYKIWQDK